MILSTVARNAEADALGALLDGGYLRIFVCPTSPRDPQQTIEGTLLAELRFGTPAFAASSLGRLTANTIAPGTGLATGTANFARCLKADGITPVFDLIVADTRAALGDLRVGSTTVGAGAAVTVESFVYTIPSQG